MKYVFKNRETNEYLGVDHSSGGYPFLTKNINEAFSKKDLVSAEDFADNYFAMFKGSTKNMDIVEISYNERIIKR